MVKPTTWFSGDLDLSRFNPCKARIDSRDFFQKFLLNPVNWMEHLTAILLPTLKVPHKCVMFDAFLAFS